MSHEELTMAVAATAELCGRTFSPEAARLFVQDLSGYPKEQVMGALKACRMEVRGVLTVHDVISRLADGRPDADEAWAMMPRGEHDSVVWSEEMAQAFGKALPLLDAGDKIAARLAFRSAYTRLVAEAREKRQPARWTPSMGLDPRGRAAALAAAVEAGRITMSQARDYVPDMPAIAAPVVAALGGAVKRISA